MLYIEGGRFALRHLFVVHRTVPASIVTAPPLHTALSPIASRYESAVLYSLQMQVGAILGLGEELPGEILLPGDVLAGLWGPLETCKGL